MSADAFDSYQRTRAFGALDGLRFLSILVVVWHHTPARISWWRPSEYGFLGVDLFFVISGFLIVTLLLRERERSGDISLRKFYMRRTLRIFPLYYTFVLGLAAFYAIFHTGSEFGQAFVREVPIYLTYMGNFFPVSLGIVWSLAAEEQFYLVWPFIERKPEALRDAAAGLRHRREPALQLPHHARCDRGLAGPRQSGPGHRPLHLHADPAGGGPRPRLPPAAFFERLAPLFGSRYAPILWLAGLIGLTAAIQFNLSGWPRLTIQLLMTGLVASSVYREDHRLMPILRWRPFARIGVVSYGIYLLHIHAIGQVKQWLVWAGIEGGFLTFLLGGALAVAVAELSFRYLERPFLGLKERFSTAPKASG